MKARHEFPTKENFEQYLRQYYAGQALAGIMASGTRDSAAGLALIASQELIAELKRSEYYDTVH